ncbi:MAG: polyketide cyclase [Candidatus Poribacteria bacterium]|nr:MAG: polyketide cyclase [Candidatus Poribacteria bacterium]
MTAHRLIRWSLYVLAGVVGVFALMALIGALLPREYQAEGSTEVPAPPEAVEAALLNVQDYPSWRPWVRSIASFEEIRAGEIVKKLRWTEVAQSGERISFALMEHVPRRRLVVEMVSEDLGYGGVWTYQLEPSERGTRIRVTEAGHISNLLMRFFFHVFLGKEDGVKLILRAFQVRFPEVAAPVPVESGG